MTLFNTLFRRKGSLDYIKDIDKDLYFEIHLLIRLGDFSKEKFRLINEFIDTWDKGRLKKLHSIIEKAEDIVSKESDALSSFLKRLNQDDKNLSVLLNENYTGKTKEVMEKLKNIVAFYKSNISKQKEFFDQTIDRLWAKRREIKAFLELMHQEAMLIEAAKKDMDELEDKLRYIHHISKQSIVDLLNKYHILTPTVIKALDQAEISHKNQLRDDGADYLEEHVYGVVHEIVLFCKSKKVRPTENLICGALLHDVLEDDPSVDEGAFINKFGRTIYEIVAPLTKPDWQKFPGKNKEEKKMNMNKAYFERMSKARYETKIIKLADRLNNLSYIMHSNPEKMAFYLKETELFHLPFARQTSAYFYKRIKSLHESLVLLEK
ncbi:HD domain-containing protein [Candidatus Woesearchaeota archaeon]|nr:HD domain-containing protein [Candidatus Woesearchaeota archaeon]